MSKINLLKQYILLTRLNQPIGFLLLMLPCIWGVLAACNNINDLNNNLFLIVLLIFGSVIMRSAGCVINDIFDRNYDKKVSRTILRPLAKGTISVSNALICFFFLSLLGLSILLSLDKLSIIIGLVSFILLLIYPLMKRITYWPQLVLGITFNIGVLIAFAAATSTLNLSIIFLYFAGIFWTLGYDTIYAHQDKEDDLRIGVKSTAILFGASSKKIISLFYSLMFICLCLYGIKSGNNSYYFISLLFVAGHLFNQVRILNINNQDLCLSIFKSNQYLGMIVCLSLLLNFLFI